MAIKVVKDSHVDHGLSKDQLDWLLARFADRTTFFVETVELPEHLGTVKCSLHGPKAGTPVVLPEEALHHRRGDRAWYSRTCPRPPHDTRLVTVVAGTHPDYNDDGMILFTAYGGPAAPQEPGDPNCKNLEESIDFWKDHALAI